MPLLGSLIAGLFASLTSVLGAWFGVSVAVKVAAVAAFLAFAAALLAVFNTAVAPLVGAMFATSWGMVLGLAFPPIAGTCLAVLAAVWGACGLYGMQRKALGLVTG